MNIRFTCPVCTHPGQVNVPARAEWSCPSCDHLMAFAVPADDTLPTCVVCGNPELYKKKDFPHSLGLAILTLACLASAVTHWLYHPWLTWTILIGSAVFDGLLYLWVGDAIVCYRCQAHYRGFAPHAEHRPFELNIGERYRQEKLRRVLLEMEKRKTGG